jgi:hypothetical protein
MNRAKRFYCDLLGFEAVVDVTPSLSFLRSRCGRVHIYLEGGCTQASVTRSSTRLSFFLQAAKPAVEVYEKLRAAGVPLLQDAPQHVDDKTLCFQFQDPDGNILEAVGPAASSAEPEPPSRTLWAQRRFDLDHPVGSYRELLERLRGTPARVDEHVRSLTRDQLVRREGEKWSIQEHAGHLIDVEQLFMGRLDDYESGLEELRPADLSGRKTYEAQHNEAAITDIQRRFRAARTEFVGRVESWSRALLTRSAMHPRLKRAMSVCDMLHFQAEHDDYHLARISELIHHRRTSD